MRSGAAASCSAADSHGSRGVGGIITSTISLLVFCEALAAALTVSRCLNSMGWVEPKYSAKIGTSPS